MKERPILFSGPMVRAILEGRKTQTRRVVKNQPSKHWAFNLRTVENLKTKRTEFVDDDYRYCVPCPHGTVGDRLWARETFWVAEPYSYGTDASGEQIIPRGIQRRPVHYSADGPPENTPNRHYPNGLLRGYSAPDPNAMWVQKPSIHMPRWASRITLEVTGVRVERLQEISEQDAIAEGIEQSQFGGWKHYPHAGDSCACGDWNMPQNSFMSLWQSINGAGSWEANPWVWVIEFKRLEECP